MSEIASDSEAEFVSQPPQERLRVGWVAGEKTLAKFGCTFQPLVVGLMDELIEITAFCDEDSDTSTLPSPPVNVISYARPCWWRSTKQVAAAIAGHAKAARINLLHSLDSSAAELTRLAAGQAGVPYVCSSYRLGDGGRVGRGHDIAGIFAASERIQKDLLEQTAGAGHKIHLVRPGVYTVSGPSCFDSVEQRVSIIVGGNLNNYRAFEAVLQSFAKLHLSEEECIFFIVGAGSQEKNLRRVAERLDLRHDLTFVGELPAWKLTSVFVGADIYVSATAGKKFDIPSLLAMAAGVPVVSAVGDEMDLLPDRQMGLLFREGDSQDLAEKLRSLIDDHAAAKALAAAALAYVHEYHSPAKAVVKTTEIYRSVAASASTKP